MSDVNLQNFETEVIDDAELVLVGNNLPHGWLTNAYRWQEGMPEIKEVTVQFHRDLFDDKFLKRNQLFFVRSLLEKSAKGIAFSKETIERIKPRLTSLAQKSGFDSMLELMSILHDLSVSRDMRTLSNSTFTDEDLNFNSRRIEKVFAYMRDNYDKDMNLADVAKLAGMSEVSFSRFIKKRTGKTFVESLNEIRLGHLFALPMNFTVRPWVQAWSSACTGLRCEGIRGGFVNSVDIVAPSTLLSILLGAVNGYALSFWRPRGAQPLYLVLLAGAFIPYQVMTYPLVRALAALGLFGSLPGIVLVHTVFGMPVMTLLFRNHYAGVPRELFMAARIDGGGFWRIFAQLMLPMSLPIVVVAVIMQVTGIWNDYVLGLVFAGVEHLPMTVQLNNVINTTTGERLYNVNMAATLLTSMVPLAVYLVSGRWFVRGIAAGAVKG